MSKSNSFSENVEPSPWCNSSAKRLADVFLASILLLMATPLMLLVAALIKLTSSGPVFFRQRRPGRNSLAFEVVKFRTMNSGRDEHGPLLTRSGDPRVTSIG